MEHDVFIAHSSLDKPTADAICDVLEREKVRCWIAPRDVLPGTIWGESIIEALDASSVMVIVFSASSNVSPQVVREVERAVSKGIPIIPSRIDDVRMTKSMEYFLSTPHWLDALTAPMELHLAKLAAAVKSILASASTKQSALSAFQPLTPGGAASISETGEPGLSNTTSAATNADGSSQIKEKLEAGGVVPKSAGLEDHGYSATGHPSLIRHVSRRNIQRIVLSMIAIVGALLYLVFRASTSAILNAELVTGIAYNPECVEMAADGGTLFTGTDNEIKFWSTQNGECLRTIPEAADSLAASANGQKLASSWSWGREVKVWDAKSGKRERILAAPFRVACLAITPDGRTVVAGASDEGDTVVWNAGTGEPIQTLSGDERWIRSVAVSPDGRTVACGTTNRFEVWNVTTGNCFWRQEMTHTGSGEYVCLAIGSDSRKLITGCGDSLDAWDIGTKKRFATIKFPVLSSSIGHLRTGSDCSRFFTNGQAAGNTLDLWESANGSLLGSIKGTSLRLRKDGLGNNIFGNKMICTTPDTRTVAAVTYGYETIKIWKIND